MNLPSWKFIRVWQRNRDVFLTFWHSEASGFVAEPVIILVTMGLGLGSYVGLIGGQDYMEFITPGIIASYAMYSATFECTYGSFVRMEYQKTYDAILATPVNVEDIIAGEISWGATRSLMTATAILGVASLFHLVHSFWALLIPLVALLQGIMFGSLAMIVTSFVPSMYVFNYYYTLFITPMFFFSGVFFPLTSFPPIVQSLSWVAPLTPVVKIARALVSGVFGLEVVPALAILVGLTVLFLAVALRTMRRRLII